MAQEIKDLIVKIRQEGIKAAQEQAAQIKTEADALARKIIADAKSAAKVIIEQANAETKRQSDATKASLKQAGRDLLISLRKEIDSMLSSLIKAELGRALTAEELAGIIGSLIKSAPLSLNSEIIVSLNEKDKEKLENGFLKHLAQETKKQIILKSANEIANGFVISFDAGKSSFDFSDSALTEYITGSLKPELDKILIAG